MKLYVFFFLSIMRVFNASGMQLPPVLAKIDSVSFHLSQILLQDFDKFAQSSPNQEVLQAKKALCTAIIHTLTHVRRLTYLRADPITLSGAIKGIVHMPLVYTASPPILYCSDKAHFKELPNGHIASL